MHDCTYDKARVLHELSRMAGFVHKHAINDAKGAHAGCKQHWKMLHEDLTKHIEKLQKDLSKC